MRTIACCTKGFVHYLRNNRAVSALEYALLVGIIAVTLAAAIANFGDAIEDGMEKIAAKVKAPSTTTIDADGN